MYWLVVLMYEATDREAVGHCCMTTLTILKFGVIGFQAFLMGLQIPVD